MDDMKKYPGLSRRQSVYQLRKRLPEDVRRLMGGNPTLWRSLSMNPGAPLHEWRRLCDRNGSVAAEVSRTLGEGTKRTIAGRYHQAAGEMEQFFHFVRNAFQGFTEVPSDERLKAIALDYLRASDQAASVRYSNIRMTSWDRSEAAEVVREDMEAFGSEDDPTVIAGYLSNAENLLRENCLSIDEPALGTLAGYLREAHLKALSRELYRAEGAGNGLVEISPPETVDAVPQSISLGDAFARYVRVKSEVVSSHKTKQKYAYLWRLLSDFFSPETPISAISRDDLSRFAEVLKRLPPNWTKVRELSGLSVASVAVKAAELGLKGAAPNTYNGYLMHLSAFYRWADDNDLVHKNLAKRLAVGAKKSGRRSKRLPFDVADLGLIFGKDYLSLARLYGSAKDPLPVGTEPTDARFWVPLIALFTGMRLAEVCQLTTSDIVQSGEITCIVAQWDDDPADEDDTGVVVSLKTDAAERTIPVVFELEKLGFVDFVKSRREMGQHRLFPDLKPDVHGYVAAPVSRWFNRHKTSVGISDKRKVFHSLRHTFRDAMRNAEVSRDVVIRMGGWAKRDQSDDYGNAKIIAQSKRELDRISYPGLDLSHLYRRP